MAIKLSILDQSVISPGESGAAALRHTIALARLAERWGYHRFWVSEHHDSNLVAGSSPEVLISHLLALTERIRIGSGGVMLQHYSPYKVAENFNVLASLAPGRVDLGIGRTPGGLPLSIKALQKGQSEAQPLPDKIGELRQFLHDRVEAESPFAGLAASPVPDRPAALYLLGASVSSAETAASLGLPYVFAQFINGDPQEAEAAFRAYREGFRASLTAEAPEPILSLPVIVADTEEEAQRLADDYKVVRIRLESGRTITVGSVAHAEEYGRQADEPYRIEVEQAYVVRGTKESVFGQLSALAERYGVQEIVVIASVKDAAKRLRSFELLKEAFAEAAVVYES
ncbi:LLM class flavin-dependent oxidoreductase [Cohnella nanjingensis]|uniref:LLM class flavin-dependent oxidoreductase n=1 Tax=Cohnella nanjingensis TaxID=1387779 RepID=A0A7X0RWF2_9BACL|nr:LLM class flavin-dependent oxidoreductase [Cohnella nanjingensis]MBB6673354.1 LLM class flavin-dependent oxidoreductase [Cohnella nanjingensis]